METRNKRKVNSFKFQKSPKQRVKSDFIENQSTLLSSYLNLMEHQRALLAILRLTKPGSNSKLIPICFKVENNQIPEDFVPMEIHAKNLISLIVPECKIIPAMVVASGEDSKELFDCYKVFCNNVKQYNIESLEMKVNNWMNIEGIKIKKETGTSLPMVEKSDFDQILEKIESLRNPSKPKNKSNKITNFFPRKGSLQSDDPVSEANSEKRNQEKQLEPAKKRNNSCDILKNLRELNQNLESQADIKAAFSAVIKLFETILCSKEYQEVIQVEPKLQKGADFAEVRLIPEKDKTQEIGSTIMIEGILPLPLKKYKKAISVGNSKQSGIEFGPSVILTNIIRYAFPDHWIANITLRGSGGRQSLISVWNYRNPLTDPCEGAFQNGLGELRLRALLDHVMRKCKKVSYDKGIEKLLISAISKALHYARSKITPAKPAKTVETTEEEEENSENLSDASDNVNEEDNSQEAPSVTVTRIDLSVPTQSQADLEEEEENQLETNPLDFLQDPESSSFHAEETDSNVLDNMENDNTSEPASTTHGDIDDVLGANPRENVDIQESDKNRLEKDNRKKQISPVSRATRASSEIDYDNPENFTQKVPGDDSGISNITVDDMIRSSTPKRAASGAKDLSSKRLKTVIEPVPIDEFDGEEIDEEDKILLSQLKNKDIIRRLRAGKLQ